MAKAQGAVGEGERHARARELGPASPEARYGRLLAAPALTIVVTTRPAPIAGVVLKAEIVRDGKTETKTETITVRAGSQSEVNISFPTAVAAK